MKNIADLLHRAPDETWSFKTGEEVLQWLLRTKNCRAVFASDATVYEDARGRYIYGGVHPLINIDQVDRGVSPGDRYTHDALQHKRY